ncbi:MAG: hypothetical protein A3F18_08090 [Legionellales bacterium RIFCSPHIGHO2_12_FULL_37_14]|nr:MAG: hypothetical protein A3F18_08090 [Legionellales bacterium RIFCSPHIGHO2_12_FULL_37_14]
MAVHCKIKIYQSIVQYLLESTNYNLKDIADLTDSSIKTMQYIYLGEQLPTNFASEYQLVRLYQIILRAQSPIMTGN